MITITPSAQSYLKSLLDKPENNGKVLRLVALSPNTPHADAGLELVKAAPEHTDDLMIPCKQFDLFVEGKYQRYLDDTKIDYVGDGLTKTLEIEAPYLREMTQPDNEVALREKVQYVLDMEINPNIAMHGGVVQLIEVTTDNTVVLQFGGGCQGCGMIDVTLKQGIEETLKAYFPEIQGVRDITDHETGDNPYY